MLRARKSRVRLSTLGKRYPAIDCSGCKSVIRADHREEFGFARAEAEVHRPSRARNAVVQTQLVHARIKCELAQVRTNDLGINIAVSYTHLDVYKRQIHVDADHLVTHRGVLGCERQADLSGGDYSNFHLASLTVLTP